MNKDIFERRLNIIPKKYNALPLPDELKLQIKRYEKGEKPRINTAVPKTRYGNEYENLTYNIFGKKLSKNKFTKEDILYGKKIIDDPALNNQFNPIDYLENNPKQNSMYYINKRNLF